MAAAARTIGRARAAPLPSPSRSPMRIAGVAPSDCSRISPPRPALGSSARAWAKSMARRHGGSMRHAQRAATADMEPSTMATMPRRAASIYAPAMAATSSPPRQRSASRACTRSWSWLAEPPRAGATACLCMASACSMVRVLCASPSSSSPVPRPQHSAASAPVSAASSAAAAVVLPMPTSPIHTTRTPCSASAATVSVPAFSASTSIASPIAGSCLKSAVPGATLRECTVIDADAPLTSSTSPSIPTSTTVSDAPAERASTAVPEMPAASERKTACVTARG
mmetsp:Transcript_640/g.1270  ORF Transcript_640/g.1270 Transcript_640/m.1270 type:complete len:282 (+) Transcript_640:231-1076(+)